MKIANIFEGEILTVWDATVKMLSVWNVLGLFNFSEQSESQKEHILGSNEGQIYKYQGWLFCWKIAKISPLQCIESSSRGCSTLKNCSVHKFYMDKVWTDFFMVKRVPGIKFRGLHILGMQSATELQSILHLFFFNLELSLVFKIPLGDGF